MATKIDIVGTLHDNSTRHTVAEAYEVMDTEQGKRQSDINKQFKEGINKGFGHEIEGDYTNKIIARGKVPSEYRKGGLVITYRYNGKYITEQFDCDDVSQWDNDNYWKPFVNAGTLTTDVYDKESQKTQKEINDELRKDVDNANRNINLGPMSMDLGFDEDTGDIYAETVAGSIVKGAETDENGDVTLELG